MRTLASIRLAIVIALAVFATEAEAHGTGWSQGTAPTAILTFYYVGGGPIAGAEIKVFAPDGPATPFQTGQSDLLGRFAFVPDRPGDWTARAVDAEGHETLARIAVADAGVVEDPSEGITGVLWLSLTANLLLALAAFRRWRGRRSASHPPVAAT
jgi:nickel transport protein